MNLLAEFIKYLYEHIGDAYVWGAQGQKLSGMTEQNLIKWVRGHEMQTAPCDLLLTRQKILYTLLIAPG